MSGKDLGILILVSGGLLGCGIDKGKESYCLPNVPAGVKFLEPVTPPAPQVVQVSVTDVLALDLDAEMMDNCGTSLGVANVDTRSFSSSSPGFINMNSASSSKA